MQKLSETPKEQPQIFFFGGEKASDNFLCYPTLWFIKNFPPDKRAAPEPFRNTKDFQKYRKGPLINFSVLYETKSDHFWWQSPMVQWSLYVGHMSNSVESDFFSAFFKIYNHRTLKRRIVNQESSFSSFRTLRKSRTLCVADFSASCLLSTCGVTANR